MITFKLNEKEIQKLKSLEKGAKFIVKEMKKQMPVSINVGSGSLRDSVSYKKMNDNLYYIGANIELNRKKGLNTHISEMLITGRKVAYAPLGKSLLWILPSGKKIFMKSSPVDPRNIKYPLKVNSTRFNKPNEYIERTVNKLKSTNIKNLTV